MSSNITNVVVTGSAMVLDGAAIYQKKDSPEFMDQVGVYLNGATLISGAIEILGYKGAANLVNFKANELKFSLSVYELGVAYRSGDSRAVASALLGLIGSGAGVLGSIPIPQARMFNVIAVGAGGGQIWLDSDHGKQAFSELNTYLASNQAGGYTSPASNWDEAMAAAGLDTAAQQFAQGVDNAIKGINANVAAPIGIDTASRNSGLYVKVAGVTKAIGECDYLR